MPAVEHGAGRRGAAGGAAVHLCAGAGRGMDGGLGRPWARAAAAGCRSAIRGAYVAEVFRTLARAQGIRLEVGERAGRRCPSGNEIGAGGKRAPDRGPARHAEVFDQPDGGMCRADGLGAGHAGGLGRGRCRTGCGRPSACGFDMHDHSGLGGQSRVTAAGMAKVLVRAEAGGARAEARSCAMSG